MPRGGRRPGAGAPPGNMNALKHGSYSRQFAQLGALLAGNPKVREALLAIAHRHNLRQHKADEVAALLLTKLFQRAEDIAAGRSGSTHPEAPEGLNLDVDADDHDSIKIAAGVELRRRIRSAARRGAKKIREVEHNQTANTAARSQSNA